MKPTQDINQLSDILNQTLGVHRNNCATVIDFAIAMQKARTVNVSQMINYSQKHGKIQPEILRLKVVILHPFTWIP